VLKLTEMPWESRSRGLASSPALLIKISSRSVVSIIFFAAVWTALRSPRSAMKGRSWSGLIEGSSFCIEVIADWYLVKLRAPM